MLRQLAFSLLAVVAPAPALAASDLSSGGLAPPPAIDPSSTGYDATATEYQLDQADREDTGRGLEFFWINAEVGVQHLGLQTFHANRLVDAGMVSTTQTGLAAGAGLGVRLIFLTLGGRFRLATFSDYQLWTLNAELGMRIPLGRLEPYFSFAGGYASLGSFDASSFGAAFEQAGVDVRGFNVRGGVGLDYYVGKTFSIGGNLSGDLLFLTRPRVDEAKFEGAAGLDGENAELAAEVYGRDGSSIGGAATAMLVLGLHF